MKIEKLFNTTKSILQIDERISELKNKKLDLRNQLSSLIVGAKAPSKKTPAKSRANFSRRESVISTLKAQDRPMRAYEVADHLEVNNKNGRKLLAMAMANMVKGGYIKSHKKKLNGRVINTYYA